MEKPIRKKNAAEVMSKFMWDEKNALPKKVFTGNLEKGFEVDQTVLIEYLMRFQQWVFEYGNE